MILSPEDKELRDRFAGEALKGFGPIFAEIHCTTRTDAEWAKVGRVAMIIDEAAEIEQRDAEGVIAEMCYILADAMMRARKKALKPRKPKQARATGMELPE